MRFVERCSFGGSPDAVWARASDLAGIPRYWHGTKEFKVVRDGERAEAEVTFAFGGKGRAEVVVESGSRTLSLNYFEGPFKGRQTVVVREGIVEAEWDVEFKGAFKLLGPWNASHFRSGTRNALRRLCADQQTS